MASNVLLSGPLLFPISESSQRNTRIVRLASLWVCGGGKELLVAAQDRSIGLDYQNRHLLDAISGKSSVTCRPQLHFVVFETKSTVRPPYMAPE